MNWTDLTIAIVAGDRREQEIARCARATGARVRAFGIPWPEKGIEGVQLCTSFAEAVEAANFALFPIPGIAPDGALFAPFHSGRIIPDKDALSRMKSPAHIILGWADKNLKTACEELSIRMHEYEWDEELMLLRGPAIVEGLLKVLIENTEITLHNAVVCQIGQGTIGTLVTHALIALGARVHVAARNPVQRAAAYAAGAMVHELSELGTIVPTADIIVTSVPALMLDAALLARVAPSTLIVDIAAPPGGIDRQAAETLNIKTVWARGLGNSAPVTVGRSQWSGIRKRIEDAMSGS